MKPTGVSCSNCGHDIAAQTDPKSHKQLDPCPNCGHKGKTVHMAGAVKATGTARVGGKMRSKNKMKKRKRWHWEKVVQFGPVFNGTRQKWLKLFRMFDYKNDRYKETLTDEETGEIVHYCEEPLSKHQGRGDAKHPKKKE